MVEGAIGPFPQLGTSGGVTGWSDGSSTQAGEGALACSSGALLGGGAPVSTSSLVGEVVGCAGIGSSVGVSDGFVLPIALGSTPKATLQIFSLSQS